MELTKLTTLVWSEPDWIRPEGWLEQRDAFIADMVARGLTDGEQIAVNPYTNERRWTDEAAAQEFIDFVKQQLIDYNVENVRLLSTDITDINPPIVV